MKQIRLIVFLFCIVGTLTAQQSIPDVAYVANAGHQQKMDIYIPAAKNFTTILFVHEGSLLGGDKNDSPYAAIAKKFQQHGIGFVNMNYRLGPDNKWPAQPDDVVAALRWLKDSVGKFGGDIKKIFILGHSSGALLAALIGTDESYLKKKELQFSDIAGVIAAGTQLIHHIEPGTKEKTEATFAKDSYLGIFGNPNVFNNASPMIHINSRMPGFLILIAESEQFQPPILEQAKEFVEKAKQVQANARYLVIHGKKHMTNITQMVNEKDIVFEAVMEFISK